MKTFLEAYIKYILIASVAIVIGVFVGVGSLVYVYLF